MNWIAVGKLEDIPRQGSACGEHQQWSDRSIRSLDDELFALD